MFHVVIAFPEIDDILKMEQRRSRSGNNQPSETRIRFESALMSGGVSIFGQRFSLLQTPVESPDRRCESNMFQLFLQYRMQDRVPPVFENIKWKKISIPLFGSSIDGYPVRQSS